MRLATAAASALPRQGMRSKRILIADDNPDGAETLSRLAERWGHRVVVAHDGHEAVLAARTFRPQVAILDIDMPRMDGVDAARALRHCEPDAVLVALTGLPPALLPERTLETCFDRSYAKPMSAVQLQSLLDEA
jgi:CheY-like chemotaxis protein